MFESDHGARRTRLALLCSLGVAWLNLLLTTRWANIPGSINGPKRPLFVALLIAATILAWRMKPGPARGGPMPIVVAAAGVGALAVLFCVWLPPSEWTRIPFLDDWAPRYQSTVDGVRMLRHGALAGWRWNFLGGYPTATDVTQDLTAWAALPMLLLGNQVGFHLTHAVLFAVIPIVVWRDVRLGSPGERDLAYLSAGLAALFATNYSYFLMRSGDTNSLAGIDALLLTLYAAHAARAARRWGAFMLPAALTLAYYSHRGFFLYAICFLAVDALLARDWRSMERAVIATGAALVAGLPLSWVLWRYPAYFIPNNVALHPSGFHVVAFLRNVYYNVEILLRPGRWFNDFTGLTHISLPILAVVAWRAEGRARTFAVLTFATVAMTCLNYEWFAYVFRRPSLLLAVFIAPPIAWFVLRLAGSRTLAWTLVLLCAAYIQVWAYPVLHVNDVRDFDAPLVEQVRGAPGYMVVVENAFHRDVDVSARDSISTPFPAHFMCLVPEAAGGRLLYAGMWDGWQWTPYRDQVVANGTFKGQALDDNPPARDLVAEFRKWGVQRLLVWSEPARRYFSARPRDFHLVWENERWQAFDVAAAAGGDASAGGTAEVIDRSPFGATVRLRAARANTPVVLRMNYHPAWRAEMAGAQIPLTASDGQLSFTAPRYGDYEVTLIYPRNTALIPIAVVAILVAGAVGRRRQRRVTDTRERWTV